MNDKKIKSFTDLNTWKEGHKLVLIIYKITNTFPRTETYSLIDQMRRCVVSITSNIAEGFSRQTRKEKVQFYFMSLGSTTELQNQLLIARDLNYISQDSFNNIAQHSIIVHKLINRLIRSIQKS